MSRKYKFNDKNDLYSSARDYAEIKGLLDIELIELKMSSKKWHKRTLAPLGDTYRDCLKLVF